MTSRTPGGTSAGGEVVKQLIMEISNMTVTSKTNTKQATAPTSVHGNLAKLPAALQAMTEQSRWLVWKWELAKKKDGTVRRNKDGSPAWTKVPYQAKRPKLKASSTDPATWASYQTALLAFQKGLADGIGYCLRDDEVGALDLDNCRDPVSGEIADWAQQMVERAGSYTEITVSGTGLRTLGHAKGPKIHRKQVVNAVEVETYRRAERFIVVTGNPLPGTAKKFADIDDVMEEIVAELDAELAAKKAKQPKDKSEPSEGKLPPNAEQNLLALLCYDNSKSGQRVADAIEPKLFSGEVHADIVTRVIGYRKQYRKAPQQHTADLFASILDDPNNRKASTYRRVLKDVAELSTTMNAEFIEDQLKTFVREQELKDKLLKMAEPLFKGGPGALEQTETILRELQSSTTLSTLDYVTRTLGQFESLPIDWVWWPFFPRSELTHLYGKGAIGKSTILYYVISRIITGWKFPKFGDSEQEIAPEGNVIIMAKEDDAHRVIRPRIEAALGNIDPTMLAKVLDRVHFIGKPDPRNPQRFDPVSHLNVELLERKVREVGNVQMVSIDPIMDFIGAKINASFDAPVREAVLSPLEQIARHYNLALVYTGHLNKKSDLSARERAGGAGAFVNAPRSVVFVGRLPHDPETRLMCQEKVNLTAGRSFGVNFTMTTARNAPKIEWSPQWSEQTADDILSDKPPSRDHKLDKAKELIRKMLAKGAAQQNDILEAAEAAGISESTLNRAKNKLEIDSIQRLRIWWWELPAEKKKK
jgi:AAA domain